MKQVLNYILILPMVLAVIGLSSCEKDDPAFIGPAIAYSSENFEVIMLGVSSTEADFSAQGLTFDASFNESVSWVLTITGQSSGAIKTFSGLSDGFTGLVWNGGHDEGGFFRSGETAIATLSFFGTSVTESVEVNITGEYDFVGNGHLFPQGDLEDAAAFLAGTNWWRGSTVDQGVGSAIVDYNGDVVSAFQGENYYYLRGLGNQEVYVDGMGCFNLGRFEYPEDPDSLYFNIYIYGTGDANAILQLEFQENEDGMCSNLGCYTATTEDAYLKQVVLDHKGWQLFSFKYSDFSASIDPNFGGGGNKIHEPETITAFVASLLKNGDPNSSVETYFDYPVWTVGEPLNTSF